MLIAIALHRLDDSSEIESAFVKDEASRMDVGLSLIIQNYLTIVRAWKRKGLEDDSQSSMDSETGKFTRSSVKVTDESRVVCFIFEKRAARSKVKGAMTMQLNGILNQCAQVLQEK